MQKIMIAAFLLFSTKAYTQTDFYYGFDTRVEVKADPGIFCLRINESPEHSDILNDFEILKTLDKKTYVVTLKNGRARDELINEEGIISILPVCRLEDNSMIYITEQILYKANEGVSEAAVNRALKSLQLISLQKGEAMNSARVRKGDNTLQVANALYETGLFLYVHPDFYVAMQEYGYTPNDTYFDMQFYLKNTGQTIQDGHSGTAGIDINVTNAWDITKGDNNIVIAVPDRGCTSNHPDLPNARQVRLNGSNMIPGNATPNDPSPQLFENHGNACAGIIAASQDNNEGISGIAPNCKIMPIALELDGAAAASTWAGAITFADNNNAKIISGSFGRDNKLPNFIPALVTAITTAISHNIVVVFASGNSASHTASQNGSVGFPANANIPGLICIAACDRNGAQANYSPDGSEVDLVAPSNKNNKAALGEGNEIWTIDMPDVSVSAGWNPCSFDCSGPSYTGEVLPSTGPNYKSYTGRFGGTSAAAPQIAGVAALMLSVNPCLTPLAVEDILKITARKIGTAPYVIGRNNKFGYGLVDANAAIENARTKYLQNVTETSTVNYFRPQVKAGFYVTSFAATGNYIIASGAHATIQAADEITLADGFQAILGSEAEFSIVSSNPPCSQYSSRHVSAQLTEEARDMAIEAIVDRQIDGVLESIDVYPNPSTGFFTITTRALDHCVIEIYNVLGKRVEVVDLKNNYSDVTIDLSGYAKGIFMVNIISGKTKIARKIVLQ